MRKLMIISAAVVALSFGAARAQDMPGMDHGAGASVLPKACVAAAGGAGGATAHDMASHGSAHMDMPGMDDAQKAYVASMDEMNGPMMAAHAIKDPDLAFNCGMIAHHAGAIAMSKVVLKYGKDPASRALAKEIIAAQEKEIAGMTAWVEKYAKN